MIIEAEAEWYIVPFEKIQGWYVSSLWSWLRGLWRLLESFALDESVWAIKNKDEKIYIGITLVSDKCSCRRNQCIERWNRRVIKELNGSKNENTQNRHV